jgi:metal-responsive CopG/Arc/MetJ family transcriptional regulator
LEKKIAVAVTDKMASRIESYLDETGLSKSEFIRNAAHQRLLEHEEKE